MSKAVFNNLDKCRKRRDRGQLNLEVGFLAITGEMDHIKNVFTIYLAQLDILFIEEHGHKQF